jgi:hypothetical protein
MLSGAKVGGELLPPLQRKERAAMPSAGADHAKRLSLSQILEMVLTRGDRDRSVVTLSRNAAGETQIEVKVRVGDSDEVVTVDDASEKASELYDLLRIDYPTTAGHDNATVSLSRNAKGETQVDVDVKTSGAGDVVTVEQAETKATEVYERLRGRYPLASGDVGAKPKGKP